MTSGRPSGRPFILCGTVGLLPIITVPGSENQGGCNGSTPIRTPYPPQLAGEGRAPSVGLFAHVAAAPQQARDCRFADAQRIGDLPGSLPVVETAAEALDQVCGPFPRAARSALLWTARCGHASQDITLSFRDKLLVPLVNQSGNLPANLEILKSWAAFGWSGQARRQTLTWKCSSFGLYSAQNIRADDDPSHRGVARTF